MKRCIFILFAAMIFVVSGAVCADLNDGLILYYPFDGNGNDESGNSRNGHIIGSAKVVPGKYKEAIDFEADSTWSSLDVRGFEMEEHYAVSTWFFYQDSLPDDYLIVSSRRLTMAQWCADTHIIVEKNQLGIKRCMDVAVGTTIFYGNGFYINKLSEGWHHLVSNPSLSNSDERKTDFYIDGKYAGTSETVSTAPLFFVGSPRLALDDFRIYNRPLSESEIQQLYISNCAGLPYRSDGDSIQWGCRENDSFYCIDIFDENRDMLYQAIRCGEELHRFSPEMLNLSPAVYYWKVWSPSGYGGNGFEGEFSVSDGCNDLAYHSDYDSIQWGCRGKDTFYCIDIFDENWNMLLHAADCGEGLHHYSFFSSGLHAGFYYNWKIWSPGGYGGEDFEGNTLVSETCNALPYKSDAEKIQWGCRENDSFYCIDVFDENWTMLYQAASCGEGVHDFSPASLNLSSGVYRWKVWSPSAYGGPGFEGEFSLTAE